MRFFNSYKDRLVAIMSVKKNGNMKINHDGEKSTNPNRKKYFDENIIIQESVVSALLHHSSKVAIINNDDARFISKTDALVTGEKGINLSITNADCYPIFFFDPTREVIAVAHAGWKGLISNIIPNTVIKMILAGADADNIRVAVGPGICHDCFEFGLTDAVDKFGKYYKDEYLAAIMGNKVCISLSGIIFDQLRRSGINYSKISFSKGCTYCDSERFFSARRDNKEDTDKPIDCMISIIGMKAG